MLPRTSLRRLLLALSFVTLVTVVVAPSFWSTGAYSLISDAFERSGGNPAAPVTSIEPTATITSPPSLASVSPATVARSGWISVTGSNFGSSQGTSTLKVDGKDAWVVKWSDTEVIGYVPETADLGSVSVVVESAGGPSGLLPLNVVSRQADGRLRWRTKVLGDYMDHSAAVAPDGSPEPGSVYAPISGLLYAWSADGALKWIAKGNFGITSVGSDGTIYVSDAVRPGGGPYRAAITAFNRDGSVKWQNVDSTTGALNVGPAVGPDGKIYAVFGPGQYNTVAFNPDGTIAWSRNDNLSASQPAPKELVFGRSLSRVYFSQNTSAGARLFAHDLNGNNVFISPNGSGQPPVVGPDENLRSYSKLLSSMDGSVIYNFNPSVQTSIRPDVGIDNVHYVAQGFSQLFAVNSNGTQKWRYDDSFDGQSGMINEPVVNPINNVVFVGGRLTFGQPGFFAAVNVQNGTSAWKMVLPNEPGFEDVYNNLVPMNRPVFSGDGATAFASVWIAASPGFSYFYAVDTSNSNATVNVPPQVTITNPPHGANLPRNALITVRAKVVDSGPLDRVEFRLRRNSSVTLLGVDTTPDENGEYTAQFTTTNAGGYSVDVTGIDTGGLSDTASSFVNIQNSLPQIAWIQPANNQTIDPIPAALSLTVSANDPDGTVTGVEFYESSVGLIGSTTARDANGNFTFGWTGFTSGQKHITAWATDNDGSRSSAAIDIRIGAPPTPTPTPTPSPSPTPIGQVPVVSITSPADGTVATPGTSVIVTAAASDSDGTITRVQFYRGFYNTLISTDTLAPYSTTILAVHPEPYDVYAVATDNNNNAVRSATIRVIFQEPDTIPEGQLKISGRIRHQASQPGNEIFIPNALLKLNLNNQFLKSTTTDANGYYEFDRLSRGGRYQVIPSEPGYSYAPGSVFYEGLVESQDLEFIASGPLPPGATPSPTPGANGVVWEKYYDGPQQLAEFDPVIAVDGQGNTYVTATTGPGTSGDTDIVTIKYSPAGEQLWTKVFVGQGGYKDWSNDLKVDAQGNVYVTGVSWSGAFAGSAYDVLTIKYDTNGNQLWSRFYNGPGGHWDQGEALAVDANGNVYVAGYSQGTKQDGALFDEFLTIKYDASGNEQWVRRRSTSQVGDQGYRIAVDASGNAYVTGAAWVTRQSVQTRDLITVKYSTSGQEQWATLFTGAPSTPGLPPLSNNPISNASGGIGLDSSGAVYVFGTNQPNSNNSDYLLLKYNPANGAMTWSRAWSGQSADYARDMVIDSGNNIYLTGESWDGDFESATSQPNWNAATVKFDSGGTLLWSRIFRGFPGKQDAGRAVVLDADDNVYVGAYSAGFLNSDTAVIKYQPDGTEQWVSRYDNNQHTSDSLRDMAADSAGNIYLTGQSVLRNAQNTESLDLVTVKLAAANANLNSPPSVQLSVNASGMGLTSVLTSGPTPVGRNLVLNATASDRDGPSLESIFTMARL